MNTSSNRRAFLIGAGAVASACIATRTLLSPIPVEAASFVRKDIGNLAANDPVILSYRKAVKAMKALPSSNPLSWSYQAAIHGTQTGSNIAWNTCEHHTTEFWPWHRMYLYWFERIIRKMSGDPNFALPYWNWSSATQRQLPAVFRDTSSELYTSQRATALNNGTGSLPAGITSYTSAFTFVPFASGSSGVESGPHDNIHVNIGGLMQSILTAGQDPIFFVHHCNIDRLWNLWLAQGGGRADPTGDTTWTGHTYTFFDENGSAVKMTPCDVLRALQQLNYSYEGEPAQVNQYCFKLIKLPPWRWIIIIQFPFPPIVLLPKVVAVPLDYSTAREKIISIARSPGQQLVLQLDDVEADRQPGITWEVYLGGGDPASLTPDNPAFLGSIALFSTGIRGEKHGNMPFMPASFTFPINPRVVATMAKTSTLPLVFVPRGLVIDGKPSVPKPLTQVKIGKVSLVAGKAD